MLCCGYTLTDFPISIRLTSLALWQSNDCPSASKATLMNMDKYFMWIHYERLHNHNKAKHNKTVCIFLGIYCSWFKCMALGKYDRNFADNIFKCHLTDKSVFISNSISLRWLFESFNWRQTILSMSHWATVIREVIFWINNQQHFQYVTKL